jgi:hypothetical protein
MRRVVRVKRLAPSFSSSRDNARLTPEVVCSSTSAAAERARLHHGDEGAIPRIECSLLTPDQIFFDCNGIFLNKDCAHNPSYRWQSIPDRPA